MERYTICYRANDDGRPALIVADTAGAAYLFVDDDLQVRCGGPDAPARLSHLARRAAWLAVPAVAPYSLRELRRLFGATSTAGAA